MGKKWSGKTSTNVHFLPKKKMSVASSSVAARPDNSRAEMPEERPLAVVVGASRGLGLAVSYVWPRKEEESVDRDRAKKKQKLNLYLFFFSFQT